MDEAERASRALRGRIGAHRLHATHDPRETTKAARRRSGRRSSERSIPTVCSNPKSALDVPRTPEPPTSLASPICALGHEQRVRDDRIPTRLIGQLDPEDASHLIR